MPEAKEFGSGRILFPKDGDAGGTWIALHGNGNVMVLLNGAFERHKHLPPYRKSRGLVFLDIFDSEKPADKFNQVDLEDIEPFTLVIWQQGELWETRWDGKNKFVFPKPNNVPQMWCSVTLYDPIVITKRKEWFTKWLDDKQYISAEETRHFHEFAGDGDERNDLRMNRDGKLLTVSITGIEIRGNKAVMHYKDLTGGLMSINEWYFNKDQHTV